MTAELITLNIQKRQQWRVWLRKHHASSPGVWLTFHKGHKGVESLPYEDLVREALCFGWVDSLIKRLDDDRLCDPSHAAQPDEQVVGHQPQTLERTQDGRPSCGARPRQRSYGEQVFAETHRPGTANVRCK